LSAASQRAVWKSRLELIFAADGEVITSGLFRWRARLALSLSHSIVGGNMQMIDLRLGP
jgi:hypothetical protein